MGPEEEGSDSTGSTRNQNGLSSLHTMALSNSANGNHKSILNPPDHTYTNGHTKSRPTYFGHDREEVTRLCLQALSDLGYNNAAGTLSRESGYALESPSVAAFRSAVLGGEWDEAEDLLFGSTRDSNQGGASLQNGLALAEGADSRTMRFSLRQQKFLELLERRDTGRALNVLRNELQPLHQDVSRVHFLSSLLMCQFPNELKRRADWDGSVGESRQQLLSDLSKCISPAVMIPEHRLATLLQKVKQNQISQCIYHWTEASPSLYCDHQCDRNQFPLRVVHELEARSDGCQIWHVEFSHNGQLLAVSGSDGNCHIYDVDTWELIMTLCTHSEGVMFVAWSPDDTMMVTCSFDNLARLWQCQSGELLATLPSWDQPVTSCVWASDHTFITGCLSKVKSLCQWNTKGELVYDWGASSRISGLAISPDHLVAVDYLKHVHVYDFHTKELEYEIDLRMELTSVNISLDGRQMLVAMKNGESKLIDIETREVLKTFVVGKAGHYVLRAAFGGANESFVTSGSEDGHVYIWHKENGQLIEKLEAHSPTCCSSVSWNPTNPCMFASGGDDMKIRIWSNTAASSYQSSSNGSRMNE